MSSPQATVAVPLAHVDAEATLAGRAPAVSLSTTTHQFPAAEVIEIIWDILQKGSQVIELAESSPDPRRGDGLAELPPSTLARLTCVARHIVQPSVRSKKVHSAERIALQSCRA